MPLAGKFFGDAHGRARAKHTESIFNINSNTVRLLSSMMLDQGGIKISGPDYHHWGPKALNILRAPYDEPYTLMSKQNSQLPFGY